MLRSPLATMSLRLTGILSAARRNNARDGITGCWSAAKIVPQLLEGQREAVIATYERILPDDRHANIVTLSSGDIESRLFRDWTMRHVPARSWMWTTAEVARGAVEKVSAQKMIGVFERLSKEQPTESGGSQQKQIHFLLLFAHETGRAAQTARAIVEAAHAADARSLEAVLTDLPTTSSTRPILGERTGGPLTIHGKQAFRDRFAPILAAVDSTTTVDGFHFQNGVARVRLSAFARHRNTGHTLTGSFRQLVCFRGFQIWTVPDFHDAAKTRAFWQMVRSDMADQHLFSSTSSIRGLDQPKD